MIKKDRLIVIAVIALYAYLFNLVWVEWLNPEYSYLGFTYDPAPGFEALGFLTAILPAFWMPIKINRPSSTIYWFLFLLVYIPSACGPAVMSQNDPSRLALFLVSLLFSFFILGMKAEHSLTRLSETGMNGTLFWFLFLTAYLVLFGWILSIFWQKMSFVSFNDVYDLRDKSDQYLKNSYAEYGIGILSGCFNPFLLGYGLTFGKWKQFILGIIGQVLIYMIMGMKSIILSPFVILGLWWILRKDSRIFGKLIVLYFVLFFGLLVAAGLILGFGGEGYYEQIMSIIFMRTVGIPGMVTGLYLNFFRDHPLTFFSHVNIIRTFVKYPYQLGLGQEVGAYFLNGTGIDYNANFLATDGIASMGVWGLPIICFICQKLFIVIDNVSVRHGLIFPALALCVATINLSNSSLFTTLLTGGLGFTCLFLYLMPSEITKGISKNI